MCGLAGIISKDSLDFNYSWFTTLGIANDKRGGDSCGIFFDGFDDIGSKHFDYGIKETALFSTFFDENEFLNSVTKSSIALLHCRKASVGSVTLDAAHPIIIEENGEIKFVLIHNGTLHNYTELAKEYIPNVDIKGWTDTKVLTHIIYKTGYEVLGKYNGAAALITVDYREGEPIIRMFRGESRSKEVDKENSSERPLYVYLDEANDRVVFSSIYANLRAFTKPNEVKTLQANTVCKFENGRLIAEIPIDRSACTQTKSFPTYFSSQAARGFYSGVNGYTEDYYGNYYSSSYTQPTTKPNKEKTSFSDFQFVVFRKLDNRYISNNQPLTGIFNISPGGYITKHPTTRSTEKFFFGGIQIHTSKGYSILQKYSKKFKLDPNDFIEAFPDEVALLSTFPVYVENHKMYRVLEDLSVELYTGKLKFPLSNSVNYYVDGNLTASYYSNVETCSTFSPMNINAIISTVTNSLKTYAKNHR